LKGTSEMAQEKNNKTLRLLILFSPILFLSFAFWLLNINSEVYFRLFGFEQTGEWVQAGCYFLAAGFGVKAFTMLNKDISDYRNIKKIGIAFFVLGMLLITLEELSWGQKIFKWESPLLFLEINAQGETNLHNTFGTNMHLLFMAIGLYGGFGWIVKKYVKSQISDLFIPDWHFSTFFFQVFLFYFYYDFIRPVFFIINNEQELFEFVLAFGFLFFSIANVSKIKRTLSSRES
jgi:uncharacterized membrane protein